MRRFHFVHAAGLRLNSSFQGVGRTPARITEDLGQATARAWDALVDFCISHKVLFLIISGGIETEFSVGLRGELSLRRGLTRLSEHGIRVFIAAGPDDGSVAESLRRKCPAEVTVFSADAPELLLVERGREPMAAVAGQSAGGANLDLGSYFANAPANTPLIGIAPCSPAVFDEAIAGVTQKASYWAVGQADEPSRRGFSPWIVESGALQCFKADESQQGARGAMLVEVEGERVLAVDHIDVDRVRYAVLEVTPTYDLNDALLQHQLMDELNRMRARHAGRSLVVDVVLKDGALRSAISPQDQRQLTDQLLRGIREDTATWDPFVWCNRLSVEHTMSDQPKDPLEDEILQEARALRTNTMQRSYFFAEQLDPLMRHWNDELSPERAERLVTDAARIAVSELRNREAE